MSGRTKAPKRTVADLTHFEGNPRAMTPEAQDRLRRSMEKFGDLSGVIYNRRTERLVGGHQRQSHLPEDAEITLLEEYDEPNEVGTVAIGWIEVEGERWGYREVDVPESREKAMNVAANRHGEGAWDYAALGSILEELDDPGDLELTGFTESEMSLFMDGAEPRGGEFEDLDPEMGEKVETVTCPKCKHEFPR